MNRPYTLRSIREMLGLGRSTVLALVDAGYVVPERGPRNEYRFGFQDLVVMRVAHRLREARVPARRVMRALRELRAKLPEDAPAQALRVTALGSDVAVRNADAQWEAASGQLLMDFDVAPADGRVAFLNRGAAPPAPAESAGGAEPPRSAEALHREARSLEARDPAAAVRLYRQALAQRPGLSVAALDLGALLCDLKRFDEALRVFDRALDDAPPGSTDLASLHFNRAIALEDLGRLAEALAACERSLQLEPDQADAHHNAARLCEMLGDARGALRHYSAARRLLPASER